MCPEPCARKFVTSPVTHTSPTCDSSNRRTCDVSSPTVNTRRPASCGSVLFVISTHAVTSPCDTITSFSPPSPGGEGWGEGELLKSFSPLRGLAGCVCSTGNNSPKSHCDFVFLDIKT